MSLSHQTYIQTYIVSTSIPLSKRKEGLERDTNHEHIHAVEICSKAAKIDETNEAASHLEHLFTSLHHRSLYEERAARGQSTPSSSASSSSSSSPFLLFPFLLLLLLLFPFLLFLLLLFPFFLFPFFLSLLLSLWNRNHFQAQIVI